MIPAAGRPTGPIVWDLAESVKQYEAWGQNIKFERPNTCLNCGREGTLVVHEKGAVSVSACLHAESAAGDVGVPRK